MNTRCLKLNMSKIKLLIFFPTCPPITFPFSFNDLSFQVSTPKTGASNLSLLSYVTTVCQQILVALPSEDIQNPTTFYHLHFSHAGLCIPDSPTLVLVLSTAFHPSSLPRTKDPSPTPAQVTPPTTGGIHKLPEWALHLMPCQQRQQMSQDASSPQPLLPQHPSAPGTSVTVLSLGQLLGGNSNFQPKC